MLPIVPTTMTPAPVQQTDVAAHFASSSSAPSIGNIPVKIVPATIADAKVSDRQPQPSATSSAPKSKVSTESTAPLPLSIAGQGNIVFESPFSTTFLTQVFGQLADQTSDGVASDLVDFDFIAQYSAVKYAPSGAVPQEPAPKLAVAEKQPEIKVELSTETVDAAVAVAQEVSFEAAPAAQEITVDSSDETIGLQNRANVAYDTTHERAPTPTPTQNPIEEVSLIS